jgi:DNA-directed RNA polymerase specialized sigma24 family protein
MPSAEDEAVAREQADGVRRLVSTELPVKLHLIDGLRFRDVSDRLGIPAATAATRIRRGKRRLRTLIAATLTGTATSSDEQRSKTA